MWLCLDFIDTATRFLLFELVGGWRSGDVDQSMSEKLDRKGTTKKDVY